MGFALGGSRSGTSASTTAVSTSSPIDINNGDLLVLSGSWWDSATTPTASDGGSNAFTMYDPANRTGNAYGIMGYVLSAANNDNATFTVSWGATTVTGATVLVHVFRSAGTTITIDGGPASVAGAGVTAASLTIDTNGTDEVVCGLGTFYGNMILSNRNLNGVAADGYIEIGTNGKKWACLTYAIYTETKAGVGSSITADGGVEWVAMCCGFKAMAESGGFIPVQAIG